jgi:hypothetical protein
MSGTAGEMTGPETLRAEGEGHSIIRPAKNQQKIQKELDFAWERSVTTPALVEIKRLFRDPAPPGFRACAGLRWWGARRHSN